MTDEQGHVVERSEYTPFGSTRVRDGPATVPHQFTGQRHDTTTGLYFYHARYYDPTLGRFIQPDAIVPDPANPQALNRYSYVQNNPRTFTDLSGHKRRGFLRVLFAAVAAVVTTIATGGQGELGIAIFKVITTTASAVLGDQIGKSVDRPAATSSDSPIASQAALLANALPTSTTPPTQTILRPGDTWSTPQRIIVGDIFPGPDAHLPGDETPDTPSESLIIDRALPENLDPLYNARNVSKTPKPTQGNDTTSVKEKTPDAHPEDVEPVRGRPGKRNKKTGEIPSWSWTLT